MRRKMLPLFLVLAAMAAPAAAQPTDPFGALLDHRDEEPLDPNQPAEVLLPLPPLPPPEPPVADTAAPNSPADVGAKPPKVEETGKSPEPPPTVDDIAYDSRLKSSAAAAQSFQGPLDGGWTLAAQGAEDLYSLELVDRRDRLEGAWRDLRRKGAPGASGLVEDIRRTGSGLTMRFSPAGEATAVSVSLHPAPGGGWAGDLTENGRTRAVVLHRPTP
jgi:hypothetical protein